MARSKTNTGIMWAQHCARVGLNTDPGTLSELGIPSQDYVDLHKATSGGWIPVIRKANSGQVEPLVPGAAPMTSADVQTLIGAWAMAARLNSDASLDGVRVEPVDLAPGQLPTHILRQKLMFGPTTKALREYAGDGVADNSPKDMVVEYLISTEDHTELSAWVLS
jgi:hypothetical protein